MGSLETPIQASIVDNFMWRNVFCWRSQPMKVPGRRVPPAQRGMPDLMAIIHGRFIGVEVKSAKGEQAIEQKLWEDNIKRAGGIYILARSWEDVSLTLLDYGITI